MLSGFQVLAGSTSEAEMVGTWRVEDSTFRAWSRPTPGGTGLIHKRDGSSVILKSDGSNLTTNVATYRDPFGQLDLDPTARESIHNPPGLMPTTFHAFSLILKEDRTFVATNIPAGFFHLPAMAQASGTWALKYKKDPYSLAGEEFQTLFMYFSKPSAVLREKTVRWFEPLGEQPCLSVVEMSREKGWSVTLTNQRHAAATNSTPHLPVEALQNGEQDGAANRSQPVRAETNRTSAAAGSDR